MTDEKQGPVDLGAVLTKQLKQARADGNRHVCVNLPFMGPEVGKVVPAVLDLALDLNWVLLSSHADGTGKTVLILQDALAVQNRIVKP